jgi:hypothetical protein
VKNTERGDRYKTETKQSLRLSVAVLVIHYINASIFLRWPETSEPIGRTTYVYEDNSCVDMKLEQTCKYVVNFIVRIEMEILEIFTSLKKYKVRFLTKVRHINNS